MSKVLRDYSCPVGPSCPQIKQVEGGFEIVGTVIADPNLPGHEGRVRIPDTMLPELVGLDIPDFGAWLREHRNTPGDMLRVQVQPAYAVPSDDDDFARYLDGRPSANPYLEAFILQLADEQRQGMVWRNLVVIDGEPTDYQRYANEFVYARTAHDTEGQVVRVLNLADHPAARVLQRTGDFWSVESEFVALVRYEADGSHVGEVAVPDEASAAYIATAELAWSLATPFATWYAAHPQYQRDEAAAA